jgi:Uma2 family endonuclease
MSPLAAGPRIAPLTVDQVRAMMRAGILAEGEPIELIEGQLVYKDRSRHGNDPMTVGERHALVVKLVAKLAAVVSQRNCHLQTQSPLSLPPHSEPEPDGAVIRGAERDYAERLPTASDAESVIEVADSSLQYDRTTKLAIYAGAAIPQYVIVNLRDELLEVHEDPDPAARSYRTTSVVRRGEMLPLRVAEGVVAVQAEEILP